MATHCRKFLKVDDSIFTKLAQNSFSDACERDVEIELSHNRQWQQLSAGLCTTFHGWMSSTETANKKPKKSVRLCNEMFDWKIGNKIEVSASMMVTVLAISFNGGCDGHESVWVNCRLFASVITMLESHTTQHSTWCWPSSALRTMKQSIVIYSNEPNWERQVSSFWVAR